MKTNCLIIDDEPLSIKLIKGYLEELDDFVVFGEAKNAIEALKIIENNNIDLMFLDINMPRISGLDLLKSIQNPPGVIIISAHKEYAIDGFELNVIDFLLKPVPFDRFLKAVNKYKSQVIKEIKKPQDYNTSNKIICIKDNKKVYNINLDDILYIESMREYVKFYFKTGHLLVKYAISRLDEGLPSDLFIRIHKSFIVSIKNIKMFSATHVEIADKRIPIGRNFKSITHKKLYAGGITFE